MQKTQQKVNSFTHRFHQWSIQISLNKTFVPIIQICVRSKSLNNVHYIGTMNEMDLSLEQKDFRQNIAQDLYLYLKRENSKNLKIFNFNEEEKRLKIANRRDKKLICIDMEKYVNGMKQIQQNEQRIMNRSVRISTAMSISMKLPKSKNQEQKLMAMNQINDNSQQFLDQQLQQRIKLVEQQSGQQQIDYQSWLNSNDQSQQQQQQKNNINKNNIPQNNKQPLIIDRNYRFQQVQSQIYNQPQSQIMIQTNFNKYKMQQLIMQNQQLRKQRKQLFQRIAFLEMENKYLKSIVQNDQFRIDKSIQRTCQSSYKQSHIVYPDLSIKKDSYVYLEPKKTCSQNFVSSNSQVNHQFITFSSNKGRNQISYNRTLMRDEQIQQFQNTKKPPQQSLFFKYFNPQTGVFDISYQEISLQQFFENFLPFNWSCVKKLNLDGNRLGSIGFFKLANYHFPQLKQISVGYNLITDIQSLQNFKNVEIIDLRANPLSQQTKFYLNKFNMIKGKKILF